MKRKIFLFLSLLLVAVISNAQGTVKINKIPSSVEEFVEMRNEIAKTPEGGAAMFLLALKMYIDNPKCILTIRIWQNNALLQ